MKRLIASIAVVVMVFSLVGCASNDSDGASFHGDSLQSSSQTASSDAAINGDSDIHGFSSSVGKPPIDCTKAVNYQNVVIIIPEDWDAEVGVGQYLKITSNSNVSGSLRIQESDLNANNSDEEIMEYVDTTMEQASSNGFTIDEGLKVERRGDLAYVIVPFTATRTNNEGKAQDYWGYSFCGYDNELILADFSCEKDDKDVLKTIRWILENMQVA